MARRCIRQRRKLKKVFKSYCNVLTRKILEEIEDDILTGRKRLWVRPWLLRRDTLGGSETVLSELEREDLKEFRSLIRMEKQQFDCLLENISHKISKTDTIMRVAIPAKVKLQVTLCFLATGASYRFLQSFFRVSEPAISKFIPEVLDAVYENLKDYIKVSKTKYCCKLKQGL